MKKPLIGLIPLVDAGRESLWMLPGYMEGVESGGGLSVMLPLTGDPDDIARLCAACDGFLFTGGHDVDPAFYGEAQLPACGEICPARDRMEAQVLKYAMEKRLPVLGICRGIQFINAALGGTLWQDLPTQRPAMVEHHQTPPYDKPAHDVRVLPGTPLHDLLGVDRLDVNTYHHQAVRDLAPALRPMAIAGDGLVEAVWHPGQPFLWAVQWHPEFSWRTDVRARAVFRAFVEAAKRQAGDRAEGLFRIY